MEPATRSHPSKPVHPDRRHWSTKIYYGSSNWSVSRLWQIPICTRQLSCRHCRTNFSSRPSSNWHIPVSCLAQVKYPFLCSTDASLFQGPHTFGSEILWVLCQWQKGRADASCCWAQPGIRETDAVTFLLTKRNVPAEFGNDDGAHCTAAAETRL